MKKSIIAIVLAIATLVTFIIPASAYDMEWWVTQENFEIPAYDVVIVEDGTIVIDGKMDSAYADSQRIESHPEQYRRDKYQQVWADVKADFFAYIVVDVNGLYIYAEIEDGTIFDTLDTNAQSGDRLQVYFDWTTPEMMHPSAEQMYEDYLLDGTIWEPLQNPSPYLSMWGISGQQYLGNISIDYRDNVYGTWGFGPAQSLGIDGNGMVEVATTITKNGWTGEMFVPWREDAQKEAIANGEQFHCGIGIQVSDDADIDELVSPGVEMDAGAAYDRKYDIGLHYWNRYSSLADVIWGEYPEGYFNVAGADQTPADVIDTSDVIIPVVAALAVAGAGVVIFSKKRKENI